MAQFFRNNLLVSISTTRHLPCISWTQVCEFNIDHFITLSLFKVNERVQGSKRVSLVLVSVKLLHILDGHPSHKEQPLW